ncbi:MAG: hypothetical protein RL038_466 [Actinomycetota bacterium]
MPCEIELSDPSRRKVGNLMKSSNTELILDAAAICHLTDINYSNEQMQAILHGPTPAVVIAGAGSGKTAVMAARVMHLVINCGYEPESILGLTFTKLATGELQSRVRRALEYLPEEMKEDFFTTRLRRQAELRGLDIEDLSADNQNRDSEFGDCSVSTYHAFATSIVQEFGSRLSLDSSTGVLTGPARVQLAASVLRNPVADVAALEGAFSGVLKDMLDLDDKMADFDLSLADFSDHLARLEADLTARSRKPVADIMKSIDTAQKRLILAELVEEFRQAKLLAGVIDYADMTRFALALVRDFESVRIELRNRFQAVLLDEYQDTSVAQRKLMQTLFNDGRAVTAVGDPLQCIYRFRGASPANIDEFINHFNQDGKTPVATYRMSITQRNGKNIVALANAVAAPLREYHPLVASLNAHEPARHGDGLISVAIAEDFDSEMDWLASKIKAELSAGIAPEDVAVILRRNVDVMAVHRQLTDRGLNCQVRSKWALLEVPEVAEVIAILRIIAEPAANADWIRVLTGPRWRIGDRDLKLIADLASKLSRGLNPQFEADSKLDSALVAATAETDSVSIPAYGDAIAEIADHGSVSLSESAVTRIRSLHREIEYLRQFSAEGINELVVKVIRVTGLAAEANASLERIARGFASNLRALQNLISSFNTLGTPGTLFDFLDWIDAGEQFDATPELPLVVHKGAIQLMTIHASKGLEYPVVALPRLYEGAFPSAANTSLWLGSKSEIPLELKDEPIDAAIRTFPIGAASTMGKDFDEFKAAVKAIEFLDERRMAYVAITRSKSRLLLSSSWLQPGEEKVRNQSPFLVEMLDLLQATDPEFEPEINAQMPEGVDAETALLVGEWPRQIRETSFSETRALAERVLDAIETGGSTELNVEGLNPDELALVSQWEAAMTGLQSEADLAEAETVVQLPAALSVSAIQRMAENESDFLLQLLRPMPAQPSRAASIGTAFHEMLERRFQAISFKGLQSELDLGEAIEFETDSIDESRLKEFMKNFEQSEWNKLDPHAFEVDFTIELNSRTVFGRIDAVYKAPADSDFDWFVIDWKTNTKQNADALQLALYRMAWARAQNVSVDRIRAGFFYAASGETVWPEMPATEEVIRRLFG